VLKVNISGNFNVLRTAGRIMVAQQRGSIVLFSSIRSLVVEPGQSVMQVAVENDIRGILADCGGSCSCATCHIYIDPAWLAKVPAPMSDERELLQELAHHKEGSRLSCQVDMTDALDGLRVTIAQDE
jgi:2Fe-2S ferredoxin